MSLSRRAFLLGASSSALAAALPAPAFSAMSIGIDLSKGPDLMAFAVGTPGEYDWQAIFARTPEEAFREWACDRDWGDEPAVFDEEYVQRVEAWDGLRRVAPANWFDAGLGHCCERCGYETHPDFGGKIVAGEVVCEDCLTIVDRAACDPDDVVEDLANRIADEGGAEVRTWCEEHGCWDAVAPLWPRAVAMAEADA